MTLQLSRGKRVATELTFGSEHGSTNHYLDLEGNKKLKQDK